MKVLALYTQKTLPFLRRIMAPFSVLSTRGHAFHFQAVIGLEASIAFAYDAIVLSDWELSDTEFAAYREIARGRNFVYDLTDPALLESSRVQEVLRLASLVTVPNAYLAKEARAISRKVRILPTTMDMDYYMLGRKYETDNTHPRIGCFGNYDWYLVKPALEKVREKHPRVLFSGDSYAQHQLGELITPSKHSVETYPAAIYSCLFGLCPLDGQRGIDTIVQHEYGMLCRPALTHAKDWEISINALLDNPVLRAKMGNAGFVVANEMRTTKRVGEYLKTYTDNLPHLLGVV